ncbi:DUF3556 domain-containing protein, partial [Nocardia brasiliensis]|uniref:DUF3556 domain-containing protein n=1 Tax=Nocardia brasiliensis TaxID=37326 RepID=UPI003CC7DC06
MYGTLTVAFLFTAADPIVAAKVVFVVIWMGAATNPVRVGGTNSVECSCGNVALPDCRRAVRHSSRIDTVAAVPAAP